MSEDSSSRDPASDALATAQTAARTAHDVAHDAQPERAIETAADTARRLASNMASGAQGQQARQMVEQTSTLTERASTLAQSRDAGTAVTNTAQLASTVANAAGASEAVRTAFSAAQQAAQLANSVVSATRSSAGARGSSAGASGHADASHESGSARHHGDTASGHARGHGPQLPPETYGFEVQDDAVPGWTLVSFEATEGLSQLYEVRIVLEHAHELEDPQALLGKNVAVLLSRDGHDRRFVGIVRQTEDLGAMGQHQRARITVVPALWTLGLRKTSRIFQGKTVPEIVAQVLREGFAVTQRTHDARTWAEYLPREYCVQYNETDLAFVQRLLAEEGLGFFFEHRGTKEVLVLFDDNGHLTPMLDGGADAVSVTNGNPLMHPEHTVQRFHASRAMGSTKSTVRDWDWTQPTPRSKEASSAATENASAYEVYSGQAESTITNYLAPEYGAETTRRQALLRRQLQELGTQHAQGSSNVTTLVPGRTFRLQDHAQHALEQRYTIVSVQHRGSNHRVSASGQHDAHDAYANTFVVTAHTVPWRPARLPRPRLVGVQTARVVGPHAPEGAEPIEIHTDEHGRIKVRFHWDRVDTDDEHASCWIRVAQNWAGQDWGFVFIPRIGMEVLVQFVDGNPDRPLVTGSVYNGQNPHPYPQPMKKTQSVIKTRSTPGGGGYNELRFEDQKGEEEVYLRAQKDLNEMVRNNHSTRVGADQVNLVRGKQSEQVVRDQRLSVGGSRIKEVSGYETVVVRKDRDVTVDHDEKVVVHGNRTEHVDLAEEVTVTGGRKTEISGTHAGFTEQTKVTGTRKLEITASEQRWVHENQDEHVGGTAKIEAGKYELRQGGTTLTLDHHHVSLEAGDWIELKHGAGAIKIHASGKITLTAPDAIEFTCGHASLSLKSDGTVTIHGDKEVVSSAGASSVKVDATGAAVSGPKITSAATGIHEISGSMVKLN